MRKSTVFCFLVAAIATMVFSSNIVPAKEKGQIVHDAEHYILKAQHGERWAKKIRKSTQSSPKFARRTAANRRISFTFSLTISASAKSACRISMSSVVTVPPGSRSWRTKASPSCECIPSPVARRPVWP